MAVIEERLWGELVPRPIYVMVIALKWIYKVKLDEYGDVLKNKARLVAKRYYVSEEGIDFSEESYLLQVATNRGPRIFIANDYKSLKVPRHLINQAKYASRNLKENMEDLSDPVDTPVIDWLAGHQEAKKAQQYQTIEAEYIAMSLDVMLKSFGCDHSSKTTDLTSIKIPLYCDNQNTMAEQNVPAQPPTRTDEQIVPRSQWLTIGKSNLLFNAQKIQRNPIFQISVDILSNTNFFQAFTALANVPAIYLKALAITLVIPAQPFELPPSGNIVDWILLIDWDDFILGNIKFVLKGETVEVFGMAIPDPLITEAIQQSSYYPKYLEMVAENTKKTP
ncbi:retrovirus-related pol polyprotein from transposon TNT 1-94 [Tanacetum coccineum]